HGGRTGPRAAAAQASSGGCDPDGRQQPDTGSQARGFGAVALVTGSTIRFRRRREGSPQRKRKGPAHRFFCPNPKPLPSEALTHSIRSSPVSIGPARSINARITSDFATFPRRAHRARRAARFLSSFTVTVGMVIP